jgi:hypothetical protein
MRNKKNNPDNFKFGMEFFKKKFIRNVKDYGIWTSIKKSTNFLIRPFYHKITYIIYELDLQNIPKKEITKKEYKFKLLTIEDDDFINQIESMEEWLKGELKESLKENGICMAIIKEDKVAGFNWVTVGEGTIPLLKLRIVTKPNESWSEQISIFKDFRKKGLANQLRTEFYHELNKLGIKALYGHRQVWNIASKMSAQKYTYRKLVKADYIKIFNIQKFRYVKFPSDQSSEESFPEGDTRKKKKKYYIKPKKKEEYLFTCEISDFEA